MELTIFPHKEDTVYALPWVCYRKEGHCYLAEQEKIEDYLPYLDVIAHLNQIQDEELWKLILQDSIKEVMSIMLLDDFYDETSLHEALENLRKLLLVFPGHTLSEELLKDLGTNKKNIPMIAARAVAKWNIIHQYKSHKNHTETIKTLQPIDDCWHAYPPFIRSALKKITDNLRNNSNHILGAYLHGSLATLDFIPGSSDLDLVYILNHDTVKDPDALLEMRAILKETTTCFYLIDRFQHHGPYILTPKITHNYIESYLPLAVWKHSRPIIGPTVLSFDVCDSSFHREMWFRRSVQYYRRNGLEEKELTKIYDDKLFVSMATLLPSLAHAFQTGRYIRKPDALRWLRHTFSDARLIDWIDGLTKIRAENLYQSRSLDNKRSGLVDRSSLITEELGQLLTDNPFLRVSELCDRVLGVANGKTSIAQYQRYFNFPKAVRCDQYEHVNRKLSDILKSFQGVTRVFLGGNISVPGISDLDFIIVTEDHIPRVSAQKINAIQNYLEDDERALMMHPPMGIIPERLLADLPWIFPVNMHYTLFGQDPIFNPIPKDERHLLMLVQLTDFAVVMNGRLFQEMRRRKEIDVRLLLNALNGLKYTVHMLQGAGGDGEPFLATLNDIQDLRVKWFDNSKFCELPNFLNCGKHLIKEVHKAIQALWQKENIKLSAPFGFKAPSSGIDFLTNESEYGFHVEGDEIIMHFPLHFAAPMLHYASLNGPLSQFLRERIQVPGLKRQALLGDILSRRGSLMNDHFAYLIENRFQRGFFAPFHFGWRFWKTDDNPVTIASPFGSKI
ncbi:MAG: nucleotidyltransferase domain-containing protein [Deltaproteobacteria bacterium]|nr:nucleotidyltransferase domain-containing protein [Deltaproteobacteria bacterium]